MNLNIPSSITKISSNFLEKKQVDLFLKRDDLIHPIISGNKWRKLKYNFKEVKKQGYNQILSFGGIYSNHLHALSYAAHKYGVKSIGVIRGDEKRELNSTLSFCIQNNMQLSYLDRYAYRFNKYNKQLLRNLEQRYGSFFMIPEGGNNIFGVQGCEEILDEVKFDFDYVFCPVGSGCTASGLIRSLKSNQVFIGFCPFKKNNEQMKSITRFCPTNKYNNWKLMTDEYFGGFGRVNDDLVKFIKQFYLDFSIKLDPVYTGKLFYFIFDLIEKKFFQKNTKLLVLHTGGIQGASGFNFMY